MTNDKIRQYVQKEGLMAAKLHLSPDVIEDAELRAAWDVMLAYEGDAQDAKTQVLKLLKITV